jgi:uncharacterized repeat protein (TIGR03803 family)
MNRIPMISVIALLLLTVAGSSKAATVPLGESVLWNFGANGEGAAPDASLIADQSGNLYGTISAGGTNGGGTVFELSPPAGPQTQWRETVLWNFGASGEGAAPNASLIADQSGNLYGTTFSGGTNKNTSPLGGGTVFELSPPAGPQTQWRETVLWNFGASGDGAAPNASLIADQSGNLYGTTFHGGTNGGGTVFELSPPAGPQTQWRETVLWNFGASGDGAAPDASLIADQSGNLYGTTFHGGTNGGGTVFELACPKYSLWNGSAAACQDYHVLPRSAAAAGAKVAMGILVFLINRSDLSADRLAKQDYPSAIDVFAEHYRAGITTLQAAAVITSKNGKAQPLTYVRAALWGSTVSVHVLGPEAQRQALPGFVERHSRSYASSRQRSTSAIQQSSWERMARVILKH